MNRFELALNNKSSANRISLNALPTLGDARGDAAGAAGSRGEELVGRGARRGLGGTLTVTL